MTEREGSPLGTQYVDIVKGLAKGWLAKWSNQNRRTTIWNVPR